MPSRCESQNNVTDFVVVDDNDNTCIIINLSLVVTKHVVRHG